MDTVFLVGYLGASNVMKKTLKFVILADSVTTWIKMINAHVLLQVTLMMSSDGAIIIDHRIVLPNVGLVQTQDAIYAKIQRLLQ